MLLASRVIKRWLIAIGSGIAGFFFAPLWVVTAFGFNSWIINLTHDSVKDARVDMP